MPAVIVSVALVALSALAPAAVVCLAARIVGADRVAAAIGIRLAPIRPLALHEFAERLSVFDDALAMPAGVVAHAAIRPCPFDLAALSPVTPAALFMKDCRAGRIGRPGTLMLTAREAQGAAPIFACIVGAIIVAAALIAARFRRPFAERPRIPSRRLLRADPVAGARGIIVTPIAAPSCDAGADAPPLRF